MGEIAEMMLDGTMCQCCGVYLNDGHDGAGYPGYCSACAPEPEITTTSKDGVPLYRPSKVNCPTCNKLVKKAGLKDHIRAVHPKKKAARITHSNYDKWAEEEDAHEAAMDDAEHDIY